METNEPSEKPVDKSENAEKKPDETTETDETEEDEYFIKWKGYSYIHCVWLFRDEIFDPRFDQKTRRYYSKLVGSPDPDAEDFFNPDFVVVDRVLDVIEGTDPETGEATRHFLVKWCSLPYDECTWELESDVDKAKIDLFMSLNGRKKHKNPERPPISNWRKLEHPQEFKNKCTLREYQVEGVSWLLFNWYQARNCILADEMGLGKTIQSITFCQKIYDTGNKGPYLIVVPLSTVGNWIREFETWTDLNAIVYHGSAQSRSMIQQYEMYQRDKKGMLRKDNYRFDALITTYEMIVADCPEIKSINWQLMIIDEAHRLKNTKSKLADNLKSMSIQHKVLLTGTPLQNNLEELYALLNFLNPEEFYDVGYFMREYGSMANKESVERMQGILKPIMLRRLKEDVEKSLKPKEETIIEVELTNIQKKYYRAIIERNFDFLSKGASSGNVPSLMNTMMELRKCCNHPFLIKGAEDKIMNDYKVKGEDVTTLHAMVQASGKMVLIHKLLPKLQAGGHKILIFSQMIRVLDILEDYLYQMNMLFERLDGRIRGNDRQAAIDRFSKKDSDRFVFLLCTRAGGLGINLTAADTVIIFDSDWNPQNDLQAQARCHRIGQKKEVKIYRLLTSKTYEREMFDRASLKLGLDRAVLQSMSGSGSSKDAGGNPLSSMSKKEVEDLLKKGAYGAIMDDDDAAEKFCEEDIDQILSKRATTIKHEAGVKGSTFSKATFAGAADNRMDIDINDPDFWEKWARKADLDMDELTANKLIIEQPRVRKQTQRYTGAPVDDGHFDENFSDSDSDGGHGGRKRKRGDALWGKKQETFKLQKGIMKGLLIFGWGRWGDIIKHCKLKSVPETGVEQFSRAILSLAASFYSGDDKVKQFIWELITPPEFTHELHSLMAKKEQSSGRKSKRGRDSESPPAIEEGREWVIELDQLLTDDGFRKHVITHSNKLLARVKVLNYLRIEILADWLDHINDDVPSTEYELDVPTIEGDPPAPWWDEEADKSLLVGIFKHGYDRYSLIRNDPSLVFLDKVGPADDRALAADLMEGPDEVKPDKKSENADLRHEGDKEYKPKHKHIFDEQQELLEAAKTPTGDDTAAATTAATTTPATSTATATPAAATTTPTTTPPVTTTETSGENGQVEQQNGVATTTTTPAATGPEQQQQQQQQQQAAAPKPVQLPPQHLPWPTAADLNKRFRMIIAAYQRIFRRAQARAQRMLNRKPPRQITERWTKREESDFYRAVSTFGTERASNGQFKWDRFRLVAKLDKKSDVSLTNYYIAFRAMCERTCRRSTIPEEELPAVYVEQISEDRASRTLLRIHLLDRIRRECLSHPSLEKRLKLCQPSSDMPAWWVPGKHDKELLMGMNRHGLSRCEIHILNDKEFSFAQCQEATNQPNPKIVVKGTDKPIEIKEEEKDEPEKEDKESEKKTEEKKETDEKGDEKTEETAKEDESMEVDAKVENEEKKDDEKENIITTANNEKEDEKENVDKPEKEEPMDETADKPKTPEKAEADKEEPVEKVEAVVDSPVDKEKEEKKTPEKEKDEKAEKDEKKEPEEPVTVGVIEVENEEQKALVEAELAKQQAANRWPKDKFLMQRAEHVCFCITQGEWPTPKLINSLTGNGINDTRPIVIGVDSPRMADSPASDYRLGSSKHKSRGQRPQSRGSGGVGGGGQSQSSTAMSQLDANAHLFSKLNELAAGAAMAPQVPEVKKKQPKVKTHDLSQSLQAPPAALAGKLTTEQQFKLLELEKSLEDPQIRMLVASGAIDPAVICGLNPEHAKLLGLTTPKPSQGMKGLDAASLLNQQMTPDMLQLMQLSGMGGLQGLQQAAAQQQQQQQQTPQRNKAKKRPLPEGSNKGDTSRPASRSSLASSSNRAPTPANEAKKRKSEDKVDVYALPNTMKIPLIMADGTKMPDGVTNRELKGLLESNPAIKVDYETLEAKLEKSKPKPSKAEKAAQQRAQQQAQQQAAAAQQSAAAASAMAGFPGGPDLAQMGITPEIMAQLMSSGMDPKQLLSMAANPFGAAAAAAAPSPQVKKNKNDPSQQKVQLINIRTFQKLERKKCPELCLLESYLKKNPECFVATESKDFVLKHPKYFPRTLYDRIQPGMDQLGMAGLGGLNDPNLLKMMMGQSPMDPGKSAMAALQAQQQALAGLGGDPKLMAMLAMGDPKLASMDPKMLQALGLGLDPKLLGMGAMQPQSQDQKMLAALGMGGLGDPKTAQAQAQAMQAQAMQLQQQLAMSMGMGGLDAKTLSALGMHGLDAASLAALTGMGGIDMKQMQLQQQQQEAQTKALAQLMGGSIDPKLLGLGGAGAIPGLAGLDEATKKALGIPSMPKEETKLKSETPTPTATPKPTIEEHHNDVTANATAGEEEKPTENGEVKPTPEENGEMAEGENKPVDAEGDEKKKEDGEEKKDEDKEVEEIVNTNDSERPETSEPAPVRSLPTPNLPLDAASIAASMPGGIPGLDAATMKALGSLGQMDPKTMKTNGLDPNLLKSLGIGASTTTTPTTSKPIPSIPGLPGVSKMPGMEGLDNETLKLLAQGDPSAMQKLMANPGLMGMDPRMMGLDMAALMGASQQASQQANQAKQAEAQLMKQFGLDPQLLAMQQLMQQQQLGLQQQQMAQMSMLGMGGLDPKMLSSMMGMPQMDQKYLQGLQGAMPGGLDAATMQQILGGAQKGKKSTPKKSGLPTSMASSLAGLGNMDMLRQQEQLLLSGLTGHMKPELSAQELQALAQQIQGGQMPGAGGLPKK